MVLWRSTRPSRTNAPKWCPFHYRNAKVGSQQIPGGTGKTALGVQNEAGQRLTEFCQENTLVKANTLFQQHTRTLHMDITRRSIENQIDYQFSSVQFSGSVVSDSLQPRDPQHARHPCPSSTPGVHPNLCPLCRWCHPTISSSVCTQRWRSFV